MDVTTELDEVEHGFLKAAMFVEVVKILAEVAAAFIVLAMLSPELRNAVLRQVNQCLYAIRYDEWMRARRKLWSKLPTWAKEAGEVRGLKPK